jgi:hypothetical protein
MLVVLCAHNPGPAIIKSFYSAFFVFLESNISLLAFLLKNIGVGINELANPISASSALSAVNY